MGGDGKVEEDASRVEEWGQTNAFLSELTQTKGVSLVASPGLPSDARSPTASWSSARPAQNTAANPQTGRRRTLDPTSS